MAEDLLKSLQNLENMLSDLAGESLAKPHLDADEMPITEPDSPYCIKHGAYAKVTEDCMEAWVFLPEPHKGEDYYSKETIMQFLDENGIKSGFHTSNIAAIAKKHVYEREILVARGQAPINGENGYYEFFFDTESHRKPAIREDGTVDYSAMSSLSNVEEGQKIAEYHPAIQPQNGYDVLGREIVTKPSKEMLPLRGKDISNDKDKNIYIAKVSGKIDYKNGAIDIKNVHEVRGDVDNVTGKIEFFGDIHIQGNVGAGVVIRASRNVTIDGVVESAMIYAGGDVVLSKGIQGNQKGYIAARGNVSAEFIEHCKVEAGGTIRSNSYINSDVYAAEMVMAEGKNGSIIGGIARGLKGISALNIGNEAETKTFVASGYSAEDYERYVDVFQKETEVQKKLSDTVDKMTELLKLKRLGKDITPEATDRELMNLNEKKDEYFEILDKTRTEKENLTEIIEKGKGSVILANDKIYRGVTVCVEGTKYNVPDNTNFMRYRNEAGRIVPDVIVLN